MATEYHIYANTGAGDPINYRSPAATESALAWTSAALSYPGTWSFGVRAFDTISNLEEQNLDCSVTIVLNSSGTDITNQPLPPSGARAFPLAGGAVRIEWLYPVINRARAPTGFHVYIGAGGAPDYSSPAATILFAAGIAGSFVANITGLANGTTYTIGVRAYNATALETNTNTVTATAIAAGPAAVDGLIGVSSAST